MPASSRGRTRLTETGVALGIGLTLSLGGFAPAEAEAAFSAARLSEMGAVAGALGGLVAALVHFAAIVLVPPAEGRSRNTGRALIEGLFSVLVGSIVGHYLAVPVAGLIPFVPITSAPPVAFGLGVFAWQTAPGVISGVKLAVSPKRVARALLGAVSKWAGPGDPS